MFLSLLALLFSSNTNVAVAGQGFNLIGLNMGPVGGVMLIELGANGNSVRLRMQGPDDCRPKACEGRFGSFTSGKNGQVSITVHCPASPEADIRVRILSSYNTLKALKSLDDTQDGDAFLKELEGAEAQETEIQILSEKDSKPEHGGMKMGRLETFGIRIPGFQQNMPEKCRWVD